MAPQTFDTACNTSLMVAHAHTYLSIETFAYGVGKLGYVPNLVKTGP